MDFEIIEKIDPNQKHLGKVPVSGKYFVFGNSMEMVAGENAKGVRLCVCQTEQW